MVLLLLNHVVLRALSKIDVYIISTHSFIKVFIITKQQNNTNNDWSVIKDGNIESSKSILYYTLCLFIILVYTYLF